ncbi:hypothetical protein [Mycoplasma sp. P36-A1]|uniref:hypothetical protein n=1 Tax=Mycoplasma sp. P36-A1 TaxID=3252900 RepID=UPI003C2AD124
MNIEQNNKKSSTNSVETTYKYLKQANIVFFILTILASLFSVPFFSEYYIFTFLWIVTSILAYFYRNRIEGNVIVKDFSFYNDIVVSIIFIISYIFLIITRNKTIFFIMFSIIAVDILIKEYLKQQKKTKTIK